MALVLIIDNYYFDHKKKSCFVQITLRMSIIVSETVCSHEN